MSIFIRRAVVGTQIFQNNSFFAKRLFTKGTAAFAHETSRISMFTSLPLATKGNAGDNNFIVHACNI